MDKLVNLYVNPAVVWRMALDKTGSESYANRIANLHECENLSGAGVQYVLAQIKDHTLSVDTSYGGK